MEKNTNNIEESFHNNKFFLEIYNWNSQVRN